MSKMIQCDQCKKTMYTDAREDKGAYVNMTADDPLYGFSSFHLCRECADYLLGLSNEKVNNMGAVKAEILEKIKGLVADMGEES